jgi:hypothetical protein
MVTYYCHIFRFVTKLLFRRTTAMLKNLLNCWSAWYVANVSIIFDAPCLFTPIALCFVYTSWHFYAFSGTYLLTRCHSASSCFLLFLCFRKVTQEIFSELDETKPKVPILPNMRRSPKQRQGGPGGGHTTWWHGSTPGCATTWCGPPWCPLTSPLCLYKAFTAKTLNESVFLLEKFRSAAVIEDQFWGDRSLYSGTLPGRGIGPRAISIDFTAISIAVAVSHDEEGVVLPWGWGLYQ